MCSVVNVVSQLTLSHRPGTLATLDWLSPTTKQVNNNNINNVVNDKIAIRVLKLLLTLCGVYHKEAVVY